MRIFDNGDYSNRPWRLFLKDVEEAMEKSDVCTAVHSCYTEIIKIIFRHASSVCLSDHNFGPASTTVGWIAWNVVQLFVIHSRWVIVLLIPQIPQIHWLDLNFNLSSILVYDQMLPALMAFLLAPAGLCLVLISMLAFSHTDKHAMLYSGPNISALALPLLAC